MKKLLLMSAVILGMAGSANAGTCEFDAMFDDDQSSGEAPVETTSTQVGTLLAGIVINGSDPVWVHGRDITLIDPRISATGIRIHLRDTPNATRYKVNETLYQFPYIDIDCGPGGLDKNVMLEYLTRVQRNAGLFTIVNR